MKKERWNTGVNINQKKKKKKEKKKKKKKKKKKQKHPQSPVRCWWVHSIISLLGDKRSLSGGI